MREAEAAKPATSRQMNRRAAHHTHENTMLLKQAIHEFITARSGIVAASTIRFYRSRLRAMSEYLGQRPAESVTITDLRAWRADLCHGRQPSTVHGYIRACRTFWHWLTEENTIPDNPAARLKLPPLPHQPKRDIDRADAIAILNAAQDNPRDYALIRMLADTGARIGGLATLTLATVDLETDQHGRYRATVWEKGRGGENLARTVYFGEGTAQALRRYLETRPNADTDRLWLTQQPGRPQKPLTRSGIHQVLKRYAKRARVTGKWNAHAWRHRFAHSLIDAGIPLSDVSQLMGHSSIIITADFYGQRSDQHLAEAHARGSWINGETTAEA